MSNTDPFRVPLSVATCPLCGSAIIAQANATLDSPTGPPALQSISVRCLSGHSGMEVGHDVVVKVREWMESRDAT